MTRRERRQRMMRGPERVTLRIDRLTLQDVSSHVGHRIADSLATTLERELWAMRAMPVKTLNHASRSATVRVSPAVMPEDLGASLARAVMERLEE